MFLWWESDEYHTYRDVDFQDQKHLHCIMELCKRNEFYVNSMYLFLLQTIPLDKMMDNPLLLNFSWGQETIDVVERSKDARMDWILRGLFAMDGMKAIGFLLYSIH